MAPQNVELSAFTTVTHVEDAVNQGILNSTWSEDARLATEIEHKLSTWQAIVAYRKGLFWSFVFSLCIVMEGYDLAFMGTLYAHPAFRNQFGKDIGNSNYQIPASWQTAIGSAGVVANMIGIWFDGHFSEKVGRKRVSLVTLVVLAATIFCQFYSESLGIFLLRRFLSNIPLSVFQGAANTYAAEVCPVVLRAYLTTYVCLCWVMGQFIASGVTYQLAKLHNQWGWRIIVAIQWSWIPPLFALILFAPDSPWWLVRRHQYERAESMIRRITDDSIDAKKVLAMIVHTTELEIETETGTSYFDCFKGTDLRRTEIACVAYGFQALIGNPLQGMTTYFFEQAGLSPDNAFKFNIGNNATSFVGTMLSWPLLYYFGRRTVYGGGMALMTVLYFAIGIAGIPPITYTDANWARASLLVIYLFVYCPSVGATVYAIIGEVGASRLRSKTVALARSTYCLVAIVMNIIVPYMLNPMEWNWSAKSGFFFAGLSIFCLI
ncbi:hypothetical protein H9Q70_009973 [Fusarium xylarioides]|nr:hypothetical protein H9Q70_009973 [Fusarium xylarioides]KAG5774738.1 hypothetical protein H9Q73_011587 [Fusarium xylarioides]